MFEPRTFPRASWPFPLTAATMLVASSGIEVPAATIVIAMNFSDIPRIFASFESFAYLNLGYHDYKELGPGEVVVFDEDLDLPIDCSFYGDGYQMLSSYVGELGDIYKNSYNAAKKYGMTFEDESEWSRGKIIAEMFEEFCEDVPGYLDGPVFVVGHPVEDGMILAENSVDGLRLL